MASQQDSLDADGLDFGAWLLRPADVGSCERVVRLASTAAGLAAMLIALALGLIVLY